MYTCERCGGSGYIQRYSHICNGICFKCNGEGCLTYGCSSIAISNYVPSMISQKTDQRRVWVMIVDEKLKIQTKETIPSIDKNKVNTIFKAKIDELTSKYPSGNFQIIVGKENQRWRDVLSDFKIHRLKANSSSFASACASGG